MLFDVSLYVPHVLNPAPELHPEELEEGFGGRVGVDGDGGDDDGVVDELRVDLPDDVGREEEVAEPQLPLRRLGGHVLQGLRRRRRSSRTRTLARLSTTLSPDRTETEHEKI